MMPSRLQHFLLSGPMLGLVAAVFQHMLRLDSPDRPDRALHQVVRQATSWHGHHLAFYYITPLQFFTEECLATATACWMVLAIGGLVVHGIRTEASRRRS